MTLTPQESLQQRSSPIPDGSRAAASDLLEGGSDLQGRSRPARRRGRDRRWGRGVSRPLKGRAATPTRGPGHLLVVGVLRPEPAAGGLPAQAEVRQPVQEAHPPGRRVADPSHGGPAPRTRGRGSSLARGVGFRGPPTPARPPASPARSWARPGPARPGSAVLVRARLRSAARARRLFVRRRRRLRAPPPAAAAPPLPRHWLIAVRTRPPSAPRLRPRSSTGPSPSGPALQPLQDSAPATPLARCVRPRPP